MWKITLIIDEVLLIARFLVFFRKSSGFSRGASIYRGVTRFEFVIGSKVSYCGPKINASYLIVRCRHHQQGRWQARIGRVAGNKDLYLGTFGMHARLSTLPLWIYIFVSMQNLM